MRNLMKFGIVLVVLAMVTSIAFAATQEYIGPHLDTWCDDDNWDEETPREGKKDDVTIRNGNTVVIDCDPDEKEIGTLEIRDGGCQVGTETFRVEELYIDDDLEMSEDSTSDYSVLNIVNGVVYVEDKSEDVFEDGSGEIIVAAGSSLTFDDGVYFGASNGDGCDDSYTLNIAGDLSVQNDRIKHYGGHLTMNFTGDATFEMEKTSRFSNKPDAITTINISGDAVYNTDKIELNEDKKGIDCDYSLAIKISGNGTWNGHKEDIKDKGDGAIFNLDVNDNGTFVGEDFEINNDDSEINITMHSGLIEIEDDIDMEAGTIEITGGEFNVGDDFELGDKGVATMTVSGDADVYVDDLYMGEDAELTIDGVRMDIDDLKDMKSNSEIDILVGGELVVENADDPEDWDDLNDLIDDGKIITSSAGMVIVSDYGITHSGKFTMQPAIPVDVDIKPGVCPNALRVNFRGKGVYPIAIVGSEDFDVTDIDPDTVTLQGVAPLRSSLSDVSTFGGGELCECAPLGPDGIPDLTLKFDRETILNVLEGIVGDLTAIPHREELSLTLFAELIDEGTLVSGKDCLFILNRGAVKPKK